jgi:osmotically-inducible protein OsmY
MREPPPGEREDTMNKPLAAGAPALHDLDPQLGARRRAVLADLVRKGLPGERRPADRVARRPHLHTTQGHPRSDAELRDRIQHRLGRLVSYPGALRVDVDQGVVRLSGRVLAKESEGLLAQVQQMAGVRKLVNATSAHHLPQDIAGPAEPPRQSLSDPVDHV